MGPGNEVPQSHLGLTTNVEADNQEDKTIYGVTIWHLSPILISRLMRNEEIQWKYSPERGYYNHSHKTLTSFLRSKASTSSSPHRKLQVLLIPELEQTGLNTLPLSVMLAALNSTIPLVRFPFFEPKNYYVLSRFNAQTQIVLSKNSVFASGTSAENVTTSDDELSQYPVSFQSVHITFNSFVDIWHAS